MNAPAESAAEDPAYRVEVGDAIADRSRILSLWQLCGFGGSAEQNAARYDWLYLDNPQGRARLYLLMAPASGDLVGAVGVGSRMFYSAVPPRPLASGTLVDFVVHPGHRSLYPALLLQRFACEQELAHCEFVYGLPVEKAVPVVARLAGSTRFASRTYVRIIRSASFIRKRVKWLPAWLATPLAGGIDVLRGTWVRIALASSHVVCRHVAGQAPELGEHIRALAEENQVIIGQRSRDVIAWRARPPGRSFELVVFEDGRSTNALGYAMYALDQGNLVVIDFVLPREDHEARGSWLALCRRAAELGAAVVRVEFAGCDWVGAQLRSAGYVHRGSRPGFVISRPTEETSSRNWWFTRFDEDV